MVGFGRVVGGDYLNATVSALVGSTLVVQAGLKRHKLTPENVAEWDEVVSDGKGNVVTVVGRAVAGGALPGRFGTLASAAAKATLDSLGSSHVVRIEWADGKVSLIKLPDAMFTHLKLVLTTKRAVPVDPPTPAVGSSSSERPTVGEQAFSFVSGLVKDRFPTRTGGPSAPEPVPAAQPDIVEQLTKLASLRDAGIITGEDFAAKKVELLARF